MGQIRWRKYDGSLHRAYPARLLGRDGYGTWLGIPSGTVGDSGKVYEIPGVVLVPHLGWWTAMFNAAPATRRSTATSPHPRPGTTTAWS